MSRSIPLSATISNFLSQSLATVSGFPAGSLTAVQVPYEPVLVPPLHFILYRDNTPLGSSLLLKEPSPSPSVPPTGTAPQESEINGIELRDYQNAYKAAVLEAIAKGKDRGVIRAPTQVGKTLLAGPLALETRKFFPNKKTLAISPLKILTSQILGDLAGFPGGVGVIDATRKDFRSGHGLVVASAYTLVRHLDAVDPGEWGLVIVDEATFSYSESWQRILKRFGFLDVQGRPRPTPGKFLLGMTADHYSLSAVFGKDPPIVSHGLSWFMDRGYLHKVKGMRVEYAPTVAMEPLEEAGKTVVAPKRAKAADETIVKVYGELAAGKKTLVYVTTIDWADDLAQAFNRKYGGDYAVAVHSDKSDGAVKATIEGYQSGSGPRVLISIGMLSFAVRATGTECVLLPYESTSLRRYGQRIGRALGKKETEPQREILVVDFQGKGQSLVGTASLPRLFGASGYQENGLEYVPLRIAKGGGKRRGAAKAVKGPGPGLIKFEYVAEEDKVLTSTRFPKLLERRLEKDFAGDMEAMASALDLDLDRLNHFLYGELPQDVEAVRRMERAMGLLHSELIHAWTEDALKILRGLHPFADRYGPKVREFIELFRKAVLFGRGLARQILLGEENRPSLSEVFQGKMSGRVSTLETVCRIIEATGISGPGEIRQSMSEALQELGGEALYGDAFELDVIPVGTDEGLYGASADPFADPDAAAAMSDLAVQTRKALAALKPREEKVIRMHYGIGDLVETTFKEIGKDFDVVGKRVHQIERRAFWKLRHPSISIQFKVFFESSPYLKVGNINTAAIWADLKLRTKSLRMAVEDGFRPDLPILAQVETIVAPFEDSLLAALAILPAIAKRREGMEEIVGFLALLIRDEKDTPPADDASLAPSIRSYRIFRKTLGRYPASRKEEDEILLRLYKEARTLAHPEALIEKSADLMVANGMNLGNVTQVRWFDRLNDLLGFLRWRRWHGL